MGIRTGAGRMRPSEPKAAVGWARCSPPFAQIQRVPATLPKPIKTMTMQSPSCGNWQQLQALTRPSTWKCSGLLKTSRHNSDFGARGKPGAKNILALLCIHASHWLDEFWKTGTTVHAAVTVTIAWR